MIAAILIAGLAYAPIVPSSMCDTIMLVDTSYVTLKNKKHPIIDTSYYAVCPIEKSLRASEKKLKAIEEYLKARKGGK